MSLLAYLILGAFLAYYWTAFDMVAFHVNLSSESSPTYVRGSTIRRFFAGFFWPFVAKLNNELGWFFSCFVSYAIVLTLIISVCSNFISIFACILIVGAIRLIPKVQKILTIPVSLVSTLVFKFVAKPLGARVPAGIDGLVKHGEKQVRYVEVAKKNTNVKIANKNLPNVDYQTVVDNLLAAKGVRADFINLQGWDKDYARHSINFCNLAEKASEDPVVVAAFILESLNYYSKNRDVALSYLARLESGYAAKVKNPNLANEIELEIARKDEFSELFNSIDLDANTPEANYIKKINEYIYSVGYFDSLLKPALKNKLFSDALANVYMTGFWCNSSVKVVGALIADGANKFKSNEKLGILFLDNVAKNLRKQFDASLQDADVVKSENVAASPILKKNDSVDDYHTYLNKLSQSSFAFLQPLTPVELPEIKVKLFAELVLYLATFKAWKDSKKHIYPITWNTFKRSIEVRMLALEDDGHTRSGVTRDSAGNQSFVHYVSSYWTRMDELETMLSNNSMDDFFELLSEQFNINVSNAKLFANFFHSTSVEAGNTVLKEVIAMEG